MPTMTAAQAEQQLTDLAEQFAQWRQQRTYRFAPFPHPLWEQAIALTAVLPLATVAKCLQLRGRDLQKRCAARDHSPGAESPPPARKSCCGSPTVGFVEVPTASPWPLPAPTTEIELHRADGARLWIRSHEPQFPLATVVRTFLEKL
jgi:hypothetical protein